MRRFRKTSTLSAIFTLVALGISAPAWSQAPPVRDAAEQADEHFRQGKALLKAGKKREAREEYLAAFRLKQSHDVAGNLGNVELALGMPRDAAEHLSFALRHYAPTGTTAEQIERVKQRLAEAKREIGTLRVSVNVPGAELMVDGVSIGRSPLDGEVFVAPGKRTLAAQLAGHETATQMIEAGKGTEHAVTLTLVPIAPAPAAGGTSGLLVTPQPADSGGPNKGVLIAGGVTSGVALIAGIVFVAVANGKASDAAAKREAIVNIGASAACGPTPSAACQDLHDVIGAKSTFSSAAFWSFMGAGAVGAATVIYAFAAPKKKASSVRVLPAFTAHERGVAISGAW